jgi:hypothetical protein
VEDKKWEAPIPIKKCASASVAKNKYIGASFFGLQLFNLLIILVIHFMVGVPGNCLLIVPTKKGNVTVLI